MPKLESLNGNTAFHEDGKLVLKDANYKDAVSNESIGSNVRITSGTLYSNKVNAE